MMCCDNFKKKKKIGSPLDFSPPPSPSIHICAKNTKVQVGTVLGWWSIGRSTQGLKAGVKRMMDDGDHPWVMVTIIHHPLDTRFHPTSSPHYPGRDFFLGLLWTAAKTRFPVWITWCNANLCWMVNFFGIYTFKWTGYTISPKQIDYFAYFP